MIFTKKEIDHLRSLRFKMLIDSRMMKSGAADEINLEIRRQFKQGVPDYPIDVRDVQIRVDTSDEQVYAGANHIAMWNPQVKVVELLGGVGDGKVVEIPYEGMPVMMKTMDEPTWDLYNPPAKYSSEPPHMMNTKNVRYELFGWSTERRWIYTEKNDPSIR